MEHTTSVRNFEELQLEIRIHLAPFRNPELRLVWIHQVGPISCDDPQGHRDGKPKWKPQAVLGAAAGWEKTC